MTIATLYWILMLLWLVFDLWNSWPLTFRGGVGSVLIFALFVILGWKVLGSPIHS